MKLSPGRSDLGPSHPCFDINYTLLLDGVCVSSPLLSEGFAMSLVKGGIDWDQIIKNMIGRHTLASFSGHVQTQHDTGSNWNKKDPQ